MADTENSRGELWLARGSQAGSQGSVVSGGTYAVVASCGNCRYEGVISIPRGTLVANGQCPDCGCGPLTFRKRPAASPLATTTPSAASPSWVAPMAEVWPDPYTSDQVRSAVESLARQLAAPSVIEPGRIGRGVRPTAGPVTAGWDSFEASPFSTMRLPSVATDLTTPPIATNREAPAATAVVRTSPEGAPQTGDGLSFSDLEPYGVTQTWLDAYVRMRVRFMDSRPVVSGPQLPQSELIWYGSWLYYATAVRPAGLQQADLLQSMLQASRRDALATLTRNEWLVDALEELNGRGQLGTLACNPHVFLQVPYPLEQLSQRFPGWYPRQLLQYLQQRQTAWAPGWRDLQQQLREYGRRLTFEGAVLQVAGDNGSCDLTPAEAVWWYLYEPAACCRWLSRGLSMQQRIAITNTVVAAANRVGSLSPVLRGVPPGGLQLQHCLSLDDGAPLGVYLARHGARAAVG